MTEETQEHYIKVAEGFGLSHKEPAVTRRSFLRGLIATGALVAMPPSGLFMPPEPKIHQVSAGITKPEFIDGVAKIRMADGREVTLRDFREEDKYDTVVIPDLSGLAYPPPPNQAVWEAVNKLPMPGLLFAGVMALAGQRE